MTLIQKVGRRFLEGDPVAVGVLSAILLWAFGYDQMWARYRLEVDGVVISSKTTLGSYKPVCCVTEYWLRGPDGREFRYVAGSGDRSLETGLPVGTYIHKERGQLGYEINGYYIVDFPIIVYSVITNIALIGVSWGIFGWWLRRE